MSLRTKVVYTAKPHESHPRRHSVPLEAVKAALHDQDALLTSLQVRQCLVKILIVDQNKLVARYPQMLMHTTPENDLICSEEQFPNYPTHLSDQAKIVAELVVID